MPPTPKCFATIICLALLTVVAHWSGAIASHTHKEIPNCHFADTVNITDSHRFSNGSHFYEGVVIPPHLVGLYDYDVLGGGERISVASHLRGCVCQLKSCVKFCCHPREIKKDLSMECSRELGEELQYSPLINVTLRNGSNHMLHVLDDFVLQQGIPCGDGYALMPELSDADGWQLFENGSLLRLYDSVWLTKAEYCLTPAEINGSYILNPINCPIYKEKSIKYLVNSIAMLLSIPFLVLTICVYVAIPELHNLHGRCLICYLLSLTLGYTMLVIISFEDNDSPYSLSLCRTLGYVGTYAFLAAFCWVSVVSFDLWHNFHVARGKSRFLRRKQFIVYSMYAWALPAILSSLMIVAQTSELPETLKPGFGIDYCWFNSELWSPMIYFYGPILVLMLFNLTMFILTALKIHRVQTELARMVAMDDSTKHLRSQRDNFGLFLRLFIVMGVTWLLEVFSYMAGLENVWSAFFWIPDVCNCAQGVIIFLLFVMKKKVKNLLCKRVFTSKREHYSYSSIYNLNGAPNRRVSNLSVATNDRII